MTLIGGSWSEGQHDLYFMVQWVCLISWRLFDVWTLYFRIMSQCYWTFDLKINGQYDLHFMVQWFYLIFWKLFDVWTSYFGIMSQYDLTFDLKIFVGHCDLYFTNHNSVILPGSGTICTKTSSSWDDLTGKVCTNFRTGLFVQNYWDRETVRSNFNLLGQFTLFYFQKVRNKLLWLSFHLFEWIILFANAEYY